MDTIVCGRLLCFPWLVRLQLGKSRSIAKTIPPSSVAQIGVIHVDSMRFSAARLQHQPVVRKNVDDNPEFIDEVVVVIAILGRMHLSRAAAWASCVFQSAKHHPITPFERSTPHVPLHRAT
ncbi:MAG TPA: hypothetical protein VGM76_04595 [Lacipirellulaceae bacterium]